MARNPQEADDSNPLAQILATASRPGWALRSALQGKFADAGKQLARLPLDLGLGATAPVRVPAAWLFPQLEATKVARAVGLADLATPEASDVLQKWGVATPARGSWSRLGLDFVGGVVTDPLTFVGGVPGLARGSVSTVVRGIGPWAGRIVSGPGGVARFVAGGRRSAVLGTIESGLTPRGHALLQAEQVQLTRTPLGRRLFPALQHGDARTEKAAQILRERALENVMRRIGGQRFRLRDPEQAEAGVDALAAAGLIRRPGWTFAGMEVASAPFGRLNLTRPDSVAAQVGASWGRRALWDRTEQAEKFLRPVLSPIRGLYDRTLLGAVPASLRRAATQSRLLENAGRTEAERFGLEVTLPAVGAPGGLAGARAAVRVMLDAADMVRQGARPATARAWALQQPQLADPAVARMVARWWDEQAPRMKQELAEFGSPKAAKLIDELYIPHQVKEEFRDALGLGGTQAGGSLQPRKHQTLQSYLNRLAQRAHAALGAAKPGALPALEAWRRAGAQPWELIELDPRLLFTNRLNSHARDVGQASLKQVVRRETAAGRVRQGTDLDEWLQAQITTLPPRQGAQRILASANHLLKRGLYAWAPASHMRNAVSAAIQAWHDESIGGLEAARMFVRMLYEGPLIQASARMPRSDRAIFLKAALGGPGAAAARAQAAHTRFGRWSGEEILRGLDQVAGSSGSLDLAYNEVARARLGLPMTGGLAAKVGWAATTGPAADWGYRLASGIEDSFRRQHFLALVSKGVEPTAAAQRVVRAFVDYSEQGWLDRWMRDLILFSRYGVGIVPPVAQAAVLKPRTLSIPAALSRAGEGTRAEQDLPEYLRGQIALRIPGTRFTLSQLGTPLEAAAQSLGRFSGAEEFRKGVLGGLTPPVRLAAENVTGTSFFTGRPTGSFRRPPAWAQALGAEELPPQWGELLRASPFSRLSSTIGQLVETGRDSRSSRRGGPGGTALSLLTGLRLEAQDPKRVARRRVLERLEKAEKEGDLARVPAWYPRRAVLPADVEAALRESRRR